MPDSQNISIFNKQSSWQKLSLKKSKLLQHKTKKGPNGSDKGPLSDHSSMSFLQLKLHWLPSLNIVLSLNQTMISF